MRWILSRASVLWTHPLGAFFLISVPVVMAFGSAEESLTLERAMALAKRYHPRLASAAQEIQVAEARVGQAWSGSMPVVDFSVTYARATSNFAPIPGVLPESFLIDPALTASESDRSFNSLAGVISARQTIFDFGRTAGAIDAERHGVGAVQAARRQVERELAFEVTQGYYRGLQAQEIVSVRESAVDRMKQHLKLAQSQFQAGKRPKTDVTQAEVDVANAELDLIESQSALKVAWLDLQKAMGFPPEPVPFRIASRWEPVTAMTLEGEAAVTQALERRAQVEMLRLHIRSAEAREKAAESGFYPALGAQFQYDWKGQQFPLTHNWYIGMALTVPVFSGFLTMYQVEEAKARTEALRAQLNTVIQITRVEVEQAAAQLRAMGERVRAVAVVVKHASDHLTLTQSRYEAGSGSLSELTDAQLGVQASEIQQIRAQADYAVAKARWAYAVGLLAW